MHSLYFDLIVIFWIKYNSAGASLYLIQNITMRSKYNSCNVLFTIKYIYWMVNWAVFYFKTLISSVKHEDSCSHRHHHHVASQTDITAVPERDVGQIFFQRENRELTQMQLPHMEHRRMVEEHSFLTPSPDKIVGWQSSREHTELFSWLCVSIVV